MSRWWRAYDEAVDDAKLILLSDKAHRAWFGLMCVASANDGVLPDIKVVSVKLRVPPPRAAALIAELVAAGLFDKREDGKFEPHNWKGRQYKSDVTDPTNAERQKRFRDKHRNGVTTVTETVTAKLPETETETETEKGRELCPVGKPTRTKAAAYSEEFETEFWMNYPRTPNMSKFEAWQVWSKLGADDRAKARQAIEPYKRFLKMKPDLEVVHACRFLSKKRFEGFVSDLNQPIQINQHRGNFV